MTDISWLTSANRKPKPKVADYTRQPVKPSRPPPTLTCMTFAHSIQIYKRRQSERVSVLTVAPLLDCTLELIFIYLYDLAFFPP